MRSRVLRGRRPRRACPAPRSPGRAGRRSSPRGRAQRAAFSGLDKTIIPASSLVLLARGLYARDYYRVRDILRFGLTQLSYRVSGSESDNDIERTRVSALEFVTGRTQQELRQMGAE